MGQGKAKKSLTAFPPLQFSGKVSNTSYQKLGVDLYKVIYNDLTITNYFSFMPPDAFLEDPTKTDLVPFPSSKTGFKFESWKPLGTEFLIRAAYSIDGNNIVLETFTYHVPTQKLILGRKYQGPKSTVKKIGHTFANDLVKELTGNNGIFLTKIVVASDRQTKGHREIFVMDWDGSNIRKISDHKSIAVSPAWDRSGTKVAYTAYMQRRRSGKRNPDLLMYDIPKKKRWVVSYTEGINSGAAFHPLKDSLFLTKTAKKNPDIFEIDFSGKVLKQITKGPRGAMNVEPAVSPDGKRIAFSSDRSGRPMIYIMNVDGSSPKRLTFAGRYNSSPTWSPDGKKIAFAGHVDSHFDIFVMNANGTDLKRLTTAKKPNGKFADNEDPTFSPDGRHILFVSNRKMNKQLYIVNVDGTNERRITYDKFNYFKPKWLWK